MTLPLDVLEYLVDRAEKVQALNQQRSSRQKEKIARAIRANPERFATSNTYRATVADVEQFGIERVFPPHEDPENQRPT